ncbi:MAG: glycosyltransferase [Pirellulales bacterium]
MRVALVITELDVGGAEKCLTELALHLHRAGVDVLVIGLGPKPIAPRDALHRQLESAGIPVRFLAANGSKDFFRAVRQLRSELKQFAPDIVQSMLWHANVISSWALRKLDVPLIGGVRVSEPRRLRHWIERNAAKRMARVVCVSDDVAATCRTRTGIPAEKIVVI